ncbi:MAG TPA: EAL domain-containing protein [Acidimicrobiales bacterium]|nr:EAL domain-containing protein [Acidimicrobiales bacterium]
MLPEGAQVVVDAMRAALAAGQFGLVFQPRYSLADDRLVGAEALVRWALKDGRSLGPPDFVKVAEQCGLIGQLDAFVAGAACRELAAWEAELPLPADFYLAVNVSPLSLAGPGFPAAVVREVGGPPSAALRFELTGSAPGPDRGFDAMAELAAMGAGADLDYFGTGFSTISTVQSLPAGRAGIHACFHVDTGTVEAIVGMFHNFDTLVVAKRIETDGELAALRRAGCDEGQGFLLGEPVPSSSFGQYLRPGAASGLR